MSKFIRNFVFWFYFCVGMTLNVFQGIVLFGVHNEVGTFIAQLVISSMFFCFWLTSVLAICYIVSICIEKYKGECYE